MISGTQLRMLRAAVDESLQVFAEGCGVSHVTISQIEKDDASPSTRTLDKIMRYAAQKGYALTENEGIKKTQSVIQNLKGPEGLKTVMDDTHKYASEIGGDICLYNAKPENWLDYISVDWFKMHAKRMVAVQDNFNMRILAEEQNSKLISSYYAIHRWFPKNLFVSDNECIYIYGGKMAFVIFGENDVNILMLENKEFAAGVKALFDIAWDHVGVLPPFGEKLEKIDFTEWESSGH